jgi:outer membrane protein OmpA-like peptidoglycan-associated protein
VSVNALFHHTRHSSTKLQEEHWIPLSDLMTGLMMMFMLIAIIFMVKVEDDAKKVKAAANNIEKIASVYDFMKEELYRDLFKAFEKDLPNWGADLDHDLTIRFREPRVLFATGKDILPDPFRRILDDFFPRYVRILSSEKYKKSIEEIRIEGHTSSLWEGKSNEEAYFLNMALSQSRTRTTLQYVLGLPKVADQQQWLKANLTANGLSSSRLRYNADGSENKDLSQRVEFRVRTNADAQISEILKAGQK